MWSGAGAEHTPQLTVSAVGARDFLAGPGVRGPTSGPDSMTGSQSADLKSPNLRLVSGKVSTVLCPGHMTDREQLQDRPVQYFAREITSNTSSWCDSITLQCRDHHGLRNVLTGGADL